MTEGNQLFWCGRGSHLSYTSLSTDVILRSVYVGYQPVVGRPLFRVVHGRGRVERGGGSIFFARSSSIITTTTLRTPPPPTTLLLLFSTTITITEVYNILQASARRV